MTLLLLLACEPECGYPWSIRTSACFDRLPCADFAQPADSAGFFPCRPDQTLYVEAVRKVDIEATSGEVRDLPTGPTILVCRCPD